MNLQKMERHSTSIADTVYLNLRKSIIEMKIIPGETINIKDISEQLGVSRSPVREAILKLEKEGLVDVIPQVGTMVSHIDIDRVDEEKFLRQSLEEKTLLLFLKVYDKRDIEELMKNIELQKQCLEEKNYIKFLEVDDAFHRYFFNRAKKNMCWDTIERMSGHYRRIRLVALWDKLIIENVVQQHITMIKAIEAKNIEKVIECISEHCSKINKQENETAIRYPEYFKTNN